MLNVDDLNMLPNRKMRTRIAVVVTDREGNKRYFRSVGAVAKEFNASSTAIKTAAIMKAELQGHLVELVPASTIEEFLPQRLPYKKQNRERATPIHSTVSKDTYKRLMEIVVSTGISRTKLIRAAVETFVASYDQTDQTNT